MHQQHTPIFVKHHITPHTYPLTFSSFHTKSQICTITSDIYFQSLCIHTLLHIPSYFSLLIQHTSCLLNHQSPYSFQVLADNQASTFTPYAWTTHFRNHQQKPDNHTKNPFLDEPKWLSGKRCTQNCPTCNGCVDCLLVSIQTYIILVYTINNLMRAYCIVCTFNLPPHSLSGWLLAHPLTSYY